MRTQRSLLFAITRASDTFDPGLTDNRANSRRQDLPQHKESAWADSRAEDSACSKSRLATSPGYRAFASDLSDSGIEANPARPNDATTTNAEGIAYIAPSNDESDGGSTGALTGDGSDDHYCVTLAITTCKRLHGFLGTAEGLEASTNCVF